VALAGRIAPSTRSLVIGACLLAGGAYLAARETSMFAVRTIEVDGATPAVAAQVREALAPLAGRSLLKVGGPDIQRRLGRLSSVASVSYDRSFPHTLKLTVRTERPLAVLREGADAWIVAADGRVLRTIEHPRLSALPRVWLPRSVSIAAGETLAEERATPAIAALGALHDEGVGFRVRDVETGVGKLTLVLRSGIEVRLGDVANLRLKLAVARRILPLLAAPGYLDVTVPERAVASANTQVEG
jgi:cell division protein FtsQ